MTTVDEAIARLAARPGWSITCWSCGHRDSVPRDPERDEFGCGECGAVTAYGTPMPRCTIVPHVDRRFLVTTFSSGEGKPSVDITLARGYATAVALEILSVSDPSAYRAFERMMSVIGPQHPSPDGGTALTLDQGRNPGSG